MTIPLTKSDCTARPYRGGDIFQVDLPSIQSQTYTFVINAVGPNSSSGGASTATYVELVADGGRWYHRYLQAPNRIPKKQLHFGPGGRSGNLDLTLSPAPGFSRQRARRRVVERHLLRYEGKPRSRALIAGAAFAADIVRGR